MADSEQPIEQPAEDVEMTGDATEQQDGGEQAETGLEDLQVDQPEPGVTFLE
jgi:hypothetical protein